MVCDPPYLVECSVMERIWNAKKERAIILVNVFGNGKGIEWNFGIILVESLPWNFAKFLSSPLGTVPSISTPWNFTFHLKIPTSAPEGFPLEPL